MALYKIQGKVEKAKGIYYEFNSNDEPLGEGGMGIVYKGRCIDERTGSSRNVAVKFIFDELRDNRQVIERARREAAIQIKHENLVEMLGFIETEDTNVLGESIRHYHVVSELLEGVTLDNILNGKVTDRNGMVVPVAEKLYNDYKHDPVHFAIYIIKNILSGLMALHDKGYIHRDIDPTNVMVTKDGMVKLIDFGIAKQMRTLTSHDKHLTKAGLFMGKPEYAAPELVLGEINEQNQTTDVYSVGILLYQCITGHPPFEGDKADILRNQLHKNVPVRVIPDKELRKIVSKATDKSRSKRYQSAAEFRVALDCIALGGRSSNGIEWKKWYSYVALTVVMAGGVGSYFVLRGDGGSTKNANFAPKSQSVAPKNNAISYDNAIALLHNGKSSSEGIVQLSDLSDNGNAEASFLLSRLSFKSLKEGDYCPDSIKILRAETKVRVDFVKAHEMLEKTIAQNPNHYQALYELGCDYLGGNSRTTAVDRNVKKADTLFSKALELAHAAGDDFYVSLITSQMNKYK